MQRKNIIQDILGKMELSTMSGKEKAMWTILLPNMEEKHLLKLQKSLNKETENLTNLYMETINGEINA